MERDLFVRRRSVSIVISGRKLLLQPREQSSRRCGWVCVLPQRASERPDVYCFNYCSCQEMNPIIFIEWESWSGREKLRQTIYRARAAHDGLRYFTSTGASCYQPPEGSRSFSRCTIIHCESIHIQSHREYLCMHAACEIYTEAA